MNTEEAKNLVVYNSFYDDRFGGHSSLTIYNNCYGNADIEDCKNYLKESIATWEKHLANRKDDNEDYIKMCEKYISKYKKELETVRVIKAEDYRKEADRVILTEPIEITEDIYYEMLEVLPPLCYTGNGFLMSEFQTESYTDQFFKRDGKFYMAVVDYRRKETWHK